MPNYELVINLLLQIYNNYDMIQKLSTNNTFAWELKKRPFPHFSDQYSLDNMMKQCRMNDFSEYFNVHRSTQPPNMRLSKPVGLFEQHQQPNNVFEIKNVGQQGPLGAPQVPLNRGGVPDMMQMMPGG